MIDHFMLEHMDQLDADLFSGDCLYNEEARVELKRMLDRWNRRLDEVNTEAIDAKNEQGYINFA